MLCNDYNGPYGHAIFYSLMVDCVCWVVGGSVYRCSCTIRLSLNTHILESNNAYSTYMSRLRNECNGNSHTSFPSTKSLCATSIPLSAVQSQTSNRTMRATIPRLIRLVPRSSVPLEKRITPVITQRPIQKPPTLIEVLQKRQAAAGSAWPANIRIEPILPKDALERVPPQIRTKLVAMMRET